MDSAPVESASQGAVQSFNDPSLVWSEASPTAADSAPAPSLAVSPDPVPSPEAATQPPATDTTPEPSPSADGPIPLDRHKAVLEAERVKTRQAEERYQRIAWAEELAQSGKNPEQVRQALEFYDGFKQAGPAAALSDIYEALASNPATAAEARKWAGKILRTGRVAENDSDAADDPEPSVYYEENGQTFISVPQLQKWQAWKGRQIEASISQRYDPLLKAHEANQQAQREAKQKADIDAQAKADFDSYAEKPHFKDHKAEIGAYLAEQWKAGNHRVTLADAYVHILTTKVLPGLDQQAQAKTLATLKTHAAASSAKPSSAAPATPVNPSSFFDPGLKW